MAFADRDRYYDQRQIPSLPAGVRLPSVTTILQVLNKPALMHWYAKEERRVLSDALLEVLSRPGRAATAEETLAAVLAAATGAKAGERAAKQAADIGTEAHDLIAWHTRRGLGQDAGSEPRVSDAAHWACMSWQAWCEEHAVTFHHAELVVWSERHGYAGRLDFVASVDGRQRVGDYKTGGIWPEAYLQNVAYRHALMESRAISVNGGVIIGLPKTTERTEVIVQDVPESTQLTDFLAAIRLWRWQRANESRQRGGGRIDA